jgi:hypothetical protein
VYWRNTPGVEDTEENSVFCADHYRVWRLKANQDPLLAAWYMNPEKSPEDAARNYFLNGKGYDELTRGLTPAEPEDEGHIKWMIALVDAGRIRYGHYIVV